MKDIKDCLMRITINEGGCWTHAYDDANDNLIHPGYVCKGNPTVGIGLLLDASGLETLRKVGVKSPESVLQGICGITREQANAALQLIVPRYVQYARESLADGIFDSMTAARQNALTDEVYNMGDGSWLGFAPTRTILNEAQTALNHGQYAVAAAKFHEAAEHIRMSAQAKQVGKRPLRNAAMIEKGVPCDPLGNGSDIL